MPNTVNRSGPARKNTARPIEMKYASMIGCGERSTLTRYGLIERRKADQMKQEEPRKYSRGCHPNSIAALARSREATMFNGDYAVEAAYRSAAARKYNARMKRLILTAEDLEGYDRTIQGYREAIARKLIDAALRGNLTAIKMIIAIDNEIPDQDDD